jgi:hypothetical protein
MSYLPQLRSELVQAAHREARAGAAVPASASRADSPWRHARRWRWAAVNVAIGLLGTVVGLSAAGVFHRGTTVGPEVPPSATADDGVAIAHSVRLLPLRVADPGGGLPWGIRVAQTTRGLTCVTVGRVDFDTVGVLGQDGAFADDGRFHPISDNVFDPLGCDLTDARGNGFVNVALQNAPASGLSGATQSAGGCVVAEAMPPALARHLAKLYHRPRMPTCPAADMREIYFGLLGPDARSITYRSATGALRTISTTGSQGAYLLVLPQATSGCLAPAPTGAGRGGASDSECSYRFRGDRGGPEVPAGVIAAVSYRDGHTCHVPALSSSESMFGSCPPVGFVSPHRARLTSAQLATPIGVREIPAHSYCTKGEAVEPCNRGVPPGYRRISGGWPSLLVQVAFTSRVAIANSASWYEIEMSYPHPRGCSTGGSGGPTNSDIHAGQRIVERMFVPYRCHGVVHGTVTYVPTDGPASSMAVTGLSGQGKPVLVGRFSFTVPAEHR